MVASTGSGRKSPSGKELAGLDAAGNVLERDPGVLEGSHQPDDVHVGDGEAAVFVRVEEPEFLQPAHVLGRAGTSAASSCPEIRSTAAGG